MPVVPRWGARLGWNRGVRPVKERALACSFCSFLRALRTAAHNPHNTHPIRRPRTSRQAARARRRRPARGGARQRGSPRCFGCRDATRAGAPRSDRDQRAASAGRPWRSLSVWRVRQGQGLCDIKMCVVSNAGSGESGIVSFSWSNSCHCSFAPSKTRNRSMVISLPRSLRRTHKWFDGSFLPRLLRRPPHHRPACRRRPSRRRSGIARRTRGTRARPRFGVPARDGYYIVVT